MFGTIRKHSTWLWIVVITLTIISFVIFFTPDVGRRAGAARDGTLGTINGRPVSQEDYNHAYREVTIQLGIEQQARARGANFQQEVINRLILRTKLEELNVQVSEKALASFITTMPTFRDPQTGSFRKDAYDTFLRRLATEQGAGEEDFLRFLRTELGIRQLQELFGKAGTFVAPAEAEELYRQENEQFTTELVSFAPLDFVGKVKATGTNLSQFYSNRMALYRVPDRLVVNFVKFDFTNYLADADAEMAKITNLDARIDAAYQQADPKIFMDTNNVPLPADRAKAKIKADERDRLAALAARKAANAFATELYNLDPKLQVLPEFAKTKNVPVFESQPFSEFEVPAGLNVAENFVKQAFTITDQEPSRGPIQGADAFFVISLKQRIPSEIPSMENILQKVMDDYRTEETIKLARTAGEEFAAKVAAGLATNKSFEKICAESKVTARSVPAFTLNARSADGLGEGVSLFDLQNVVQSMSPGQASKFSPTREGGFVVFLKSRLPVSEDKLRQELPAFTAELRQRRQGQAFNEWFRTSLQTVRLSGRLASTGGTGN